MSPEGFEELLSHAEFAESAEFLDGAGSASPLSCSHAEFAEFLDHAEFAESAEFSSRCRNPRWKSGAFVAVHDALDAVP